MNSTTITIKCANGHVIAIDLAEETPDFEIIETEERGMGIEKHYEAIIDTACDECDESITVILEVWEYPEGVSNRQEITVDNGEVIDECDLWPFVS